MGLGSSAHAHRQFADRKLRDLETHLVNARTARTAREQLVHLSASLVLFGEISAHLRSATEFGSAPVDATNLTRALERWRKELVKLEAAVRSALP